MRPRLLLLLLLFGVSWLGRPVASDAREVAPCVSEAERTDAAQNAQWKAFRRGAVALPPLVYLSADRTFVEIAMLYFRSTDLAAATRLRLVLPLFLDDCTPAGRTVVTPLGGFREDRDGVAGLVGTYFFRRDALATSDVLFPLFAHFSGPTSSSTLLPLLTLYRWSDAEQSTTVFLDAYLRTHTRGGWDFGLTPLYFGSRHPDGEHFDLVPPLLLARWGDLTEDTLVLGPFYRRAHAAGGWDAGLLPLYLGARHRSALGTEYLDVLPPLAYAQWGDSSTETTMLGTFYERRHLDSGDWDAGFLPFYAGARHHTPRGYSYLDAVMLLYFRWGETPEHYFVGLLPPAYYHARDDGAWAFGLPPLYFGSRDGARHQDVIPPLALAHFGDAEADHWRVGPYLSTEHSDGRYKHALLPVYFDEGDLEHHTSIGLVPPLWVHREPDAWDAGILPLWFGGRGWDRYYDVVPALLFARWGDVDQQTRVFGPFYHRTHRPTTDFDAGVLPLWSMGQHGDHHYLAFPALLFGTWSQGDERDVWWLNYHHGQRVVNQTFQYNDQVIPFYFDWGDAHEFHAVAPLPPSWLTVGEHRYSAGILPVFAIGKSAHSQYQYTPVAWHRRDAHGWDLGVAPLFAAGGDHGGKDQAHYALVLPPLFIHAGDRTHETTVVAQTWSHRFADAHSHGWDAGSLPFYVGGRRTDTATAELHYYDAVLPPLVMRWGTRSEHNLAITPLWFSHEEASHLRIVTPLVYYDRTADESLLLTPLFVKHEQPKLAREELIVFPVWWKFASRNNEVNVGFPLLWDFHSKVNGTRLSVLAPLALRWDQPEETTTVVLNTVYTRGKGANAAAWSFHLFPVLDLASYNRDHFRWQVLLGLLGHERQNEQTRWRVMYLWTNPT